MTTDLPRNESVAYLSHICFFFFYMVSYVLPEKMTVPKINRVFGRDLTPPNVFLDGEENVKLGDFGLATSKKARERVADLQLKVKRRGLAFCLLQARTIDFTIIRSASSRNSSVGGLLGSVRWHLKLVENTAQPRSSGTGVGYEGLRGAVC